MYSPQDRPHLDFLFKTLCDSVVFLKTCRHVRSGALALPRKLVGLTFRLSLKTYKCNPVMMFARRFPPLLLPPHPLTTILSLFLLAGDY